jgi:hypothetical protein
MPLLIPEPSAWDVLVFHPSRSGPGNEPSKRTAAVISSFTT